MDKLRELLDRWHESPLAFASSLIAAVLALWGLFGIYLDVSKALGSDVANLGLAAGLLFLGMVVLLPLVSWNFRRGMKLPLAQNHLCPHAVQHWQIRRNGERTLTVQKDFLFYRPPRPIDLSDTVFGSLNVDYDELSYNSPDAEVVDVDQFKPGVVRVFWKPRDGSVDLGKVYKHELTQQYPPGKNACRKAITIASKELVVRLDVHVSTERRIERAIAYRQRLGQRYTNAADIIERATKIRRTKAPPPSKETEHSIKWTVEHLRPGEVYYIVVLLDEDDR